jgi:hypothetical protein
MRQFVHQHDLWGPTDHGVGIHFGKNGAAVSDFAASDNLQPFHHRGGVDATVSFDQADDHVGAARRAPATFLEHRIRLADSWRGAEVDAEFASHKLFSCVTDVGSRHTRNMPARCVTATASSRADTILTGINAILTQSA